ncbi:MAG: OmpA family protein [Bacteroidetes bacterium]|nr:OmpA family protein [Bacteroidota bacterium]
MKKSIMFLLAVLFAAGIHAQLRIALVGGGHQSTVIEENNITGWDTATGNYYSGRIGIHGGFVADLPFSAKSKISFQPGVIFHMKGRKFSRTYNPPLSNVINKKSTQYVNYIDIPLNLVFKFGRKAKFIIGGGPYGSFFFNGKETAQTTTTTGVSAASENDDLPVGKKEGQYEVLNYGVNGLAGIEIGRVFITANYSRGLNDFYHPIGYTGSFKHQVIGGTIGIFLGNTVKIEKKPKDKDKDGIPDDKDQCPDEAGTALTNGCPDKDGDGIADKDDKCPDQGGTKSNNGCPISDRDKDGLNDNDDKCPDIAGVARFEGCPVPDTDKDGVNDEEDQCPKIPGLAKYKGCPIPDGDGDGVNDDVDKCPTEKGTAMYNGCPPPPVEKEVIEKVNYAAKRIQFQSGKAILLPASLKVLDDVAALLKTNPGLQLGIEGHTSADGGLAFNMKLSEDRALSVKNYLLKKGVDESRLRAEGFGPTRPLNQGKTTAERIQNRRVELKLSN